MFVRVCVLQVCVSYRKMPKLPHLMKVSQHTVSYKKTPSEYNVINGDVSMYFENHYIVGHSIIQWLQ